MFYYKLKMIVLYLFISTIIITLARSTHFVTGDEFHKDDQHFKEVYECFMDIYVCPNEKFSVVKCKYPKKWN